MVRRGSPEMNFQSLSSKHICKQAVDFVASVVRFPNLGSPYNFRSKCSPSSVGNARQNTRISFPGEGRSDLLFPHVVTGRFLGGQAKWADGMRSLLPGCTTIV
jgi:hypothetical protein